MPEHSTDEEEPRRRKRWKLRDLKIDRVDRITGGRGGDNPGAKVLLAKSRRPTSVPEDSEPFHREEPTGVDKRHMTRAERRQANHDNVRAAIEELIELGVDPGEAARTVLGRRDRTRQLSDFTAAPRQTAKEGTMTNQPMTKGRVHDVIRKRAEELREEDPDLSQEEAELRVVDESPGLVEKYRDAADEPEPEPARPAVGPSMTLRNAASAELDRLVKRYEIEREFPDYNAALEWTLKADPTAGDLAALRTCPEGVMPLERGLERLEKRLGTSHDVVKIAKSL